MHRTTWTLLIKLSLLLLLPPGPWGARCGWALRIWVILTCLPPTYPPTLPAFLLPPYLPTSLSPYLPNCYSPTHPPAHLHACACAKTNKHTHTHACQYTCECGCIFLKLAWHLEVEADAAQHPVSSPKEFFLARVALANAVFSWRRRNSWPHHHSPLGLWQITLHVTYLYTSLNSIWFITLALSGESSAGAFAGAEEEKGGAVRAPWQPLLCARETMTRYPLWLPAVREPD